uniref:Predicted RNA binding protein YcfA, dsRBD-like fold, HicA-like mRNA interferase family n=1 Tax=Candidatus Kentrum sp. LFY TaxID=2126342 RepID=A0A450V6L5_9GAMM|nr:MAG: Predicted RNA binding protein YcfA, dsRBD-like fold, HicA-like mRNA interferase family [Candidatus Kentron sp. LFY]
MPKFPVDAPNRQVVKTLRILGFRLVREGNHIAMERMNADGTSTPLTMPNHPTIKFSTLRTILTQAGIPRDNFLKVYNRMQKGV